MTVAVPVLDGGQPQTTAGPLAFPVGTVMTVMGSYTNGVIERVGIELSRSNACGSNPPFEAQTKVRLTFINTGIPTGAYPVLDSSVGPASAAIYYRAELLPDGGFITAEEGTAQSGNFEINCPR